MREASRLGWRSAGWHRCSYCSWHTPLSKRVLALSICSARRHQVLVNQTVATVALAFVPIPTLLDLWNAHASHLQPASHRLLLELQLCCAGRPLSIGADACLTGAAAKAGPAMISCFDIHRFLFLVLFPSVSSPATLCVSLCRLRSRCWAPG